jgi:glutamine cyclotransferase
MALLIFGVVIVVLVNNRPVNDTALRYTYEIIKTYPHDMKAFTEGLAFDNDVLYESTGLYGNSTLRRVQLETGKAHCRISSSAKESRSSTTGSFN